MHPEYDNVTCDQRAREVMRDPWAVNPPPPSIPGFVALLVTAAVNIPEEGESIVI